MTLMFVSIGIISLIAIGYRFISRMTSKEPLTYRAE